MIELENYDNSVKKCNICFEEINELDKFQCNVCNYIFCRECFRRYTIDYNYNTCAQCRSSLSIVVTDNPNYDGVFRRQNVYRYFKGRIFERFVYTILYCMLVLTAYFFGYLVTKKKSFAYIAINTMIGLILFCILAVVLLFCISISNN